MKVTLRETKWSVPWFNCDESLTWRGLILNPRQFRFVFLLSLFVWRIAFACLMVCRWQVRMACSDKDCGRNRRPSAEDRGWSHRSGTRWPGDREVGWHRVRSAPCTRRRGARVSWLSLKTKVDGLSVIWPQNHWDGFSSVWASELVATVCEWFGLKTTRTVFTGLASKPVATVCEWFGLKTTQMVFAGLTSKPVATVFTSLASKPVVSVF
jgi:hypothetical protein